VISGFEPVKLLGRGGFAEVFLYQQASPRRQVALKVLLTRDVGSEAIQRLAQEADLMAELSTHPHIATVYTSGLTDDGRPYLAMEYCPHPSLNVGLRTTSRKIDEVLKIGVEIAGAVETAHQAGVLHRDIKPANILMTLYGHPVLTDFGIAVSMRQATEQAEGLSVPWSPPEAFTTPPTAGLHSDVWGLAATIYSLLAGRAPFEVTGGENSASAQMHRIEHEPLPPIGRADCPASLGRVLEVAMAKQPAQRYPTVLALGRALQRVQAELGIDPTQMVIQEDPQPDRPPEQDEAGLTRLRRPRLVDQEEAPGQTGPTMTYDLPSAATEAFDETLLTPTRPSTLRNQPYQYEGSLLVGPHGTNPPPLSSAGTASAAAGGPGGPSGAPGQAKPSKKLRTGMVFSSSVVLIAAAVGLVWALALRGGPEPVDYVAEERTPAVVEEPSTPTPTPAPTPTARTTPTPTVPPLQVGTCLTVSPGELLTDRPDNWKTMTADCGSTAAAVRIVGVDSECPDNTGCLSFAAGTSTYQFNSFPVEGVCAPGFGFGADGEGSAWLQAWSPCGDYRRPPGVDSPESMQQAASLWGVSVGELWPAKWRIDKFVNDPDYCDPGQLYWSGIIFDGRQYSVCCTQQ